MPVSDPPSLPAQFTRELPFSRSGFILTRGPAMNLRLHTIDTGERGATPVVLLHGNPTWSFLWRKVIARLSSFRCVAPDLLGFGLSSRLDRVADHSLERHADSIAELVDGLDLEGCVLVGQDWGGPIAAAVGSRLPDRIAGIVLANTSVLVPKRPRGTPLHRLARMPIVSDLLVRGLGLPHRLLWAVQGDRRSIRGNVAAAYRWPFRHLSDRIGPLALLRMVPDSTDHPSIPALRRGQDWITSFEGPMALVWGVRDPILGRALIRHERAFPHASVTRTDAGHFLQEEVPDALAAAIEAVAARADGKSEIRPAD